MYLILILIYQFASVDNDVLHVTSDSDIDSVDYDKLASDHNDRRKKFWTKLENDGMLVQYKSLLHLKLYALLELSVMHKYSLQ